MKVEVKVIATEFLSRTYNIDCGDGKQHIYWIASTACLLFGQDHYPAGIYIPNSLTKADEDDFPHPQVPIYKVFQDGDKCEVTLKDRSREETDIEKRWYDQAFGKERNIMRINVEFVPKTEVIKTTKSCAIFIKIKHQMYPELFDEFKNSSFKPEFEAKMDRSLYHDGTNYFTYEIEIPYGNLEYEYFYTMGEEEKKPVPEIDLQGIKVIQFPDEIVSAEEQKQLDMMEEEDIKRREKEQKNAHKLALEKRAKEAAERQQQMLLQEQNSLKLDIYWKEMDLNFHSSLEDANAALSIFSLYYDTITDYFSFYASLQPQFYTFKENEFITLQSFIHFLKLFGVATTKDEINLYFQQLNTLIIPPVDNTLNIKNGLNFAQFLEAILRITDIKAKSTDQPDHEENYRLMLQQIFQDATMSIKRKSEDDELIVQLYTPESQQLFYDKYGLFGALFQNQSMTNNSIHLGLQFNEFVHILSQAGIAQNEETKEEVKEGQLKKITKGEVIQILRQIDVFDGESEDENDPKLLTYVDFLEALVRVAAHYPFGEREEYQRMEDKLNYITSKLEAKFGDLVEGFIKSLRAKDEEMKFTPKMVINENDDGEGESGEEGEDDGDY